jgi:hypothetical protein
MSLHQFTYLSVCLHFSRYVYLFFYLSIFECLPVCLSAFLSISHSVYMSVCFVFLSIIMCLSVYRLSILVSLCVCLSTVCLSLYHYVSLCQTICPNL